MNKWLVPSLRVLNTDMNPSPNYHILLYITIVVVQMLRVDHPMLNPDRSLNLAILQEARCDNSQFASFDELQ